MKIKIKLDEGAYMPHKAHEADAGFDLYIPRGDKQYFLRDHLEIDTGVHISIPKGYYGTVVNRSGLNFKYHVTLHGCGTIDSGYTGPIKVMLYNDSGMPERFLPGNRVAQLIILPVPEIELELVDELENTERGANGFGSTGR